MDDADNLTTRSQAVLSTGQFCLEETVNSCRDLLPTESALALISSNTDAYAVRALSARQALHSLDLMYYRWNEDLTGRLLMGECLAAADRGVRVRLILDDVGVSSSDAQLQALHSHPNIAVQLFNPTQVRMRGVGRWLEMALRMFSMNRRMHNKAWIVDDSLAILGGRNIGDGYFDASKLSNFRDLDLVAIGPVASDAKKLFERFWNSGFAAPVPESDDHQKVALTLGTLRGFSKSKQARPFLGHVARQAGPELQNKRPLHRCIGARLVADMPEKVLGRKGENGMMASLWPLLEGAQKRISIISPYFVPGVSGTRRLIELASRGIKIGVLTNSLAATDVAAVHGGYARYRRMLLRGKIALYELRTTAPRRRLAFRGKSNAMLHTKAIAVDGRTGFIGSLNFDPRSTSLNTEMGVVFELPELLVAMDRLFAEEISSEVSYPVRLNGAGQLYWLDDTKILWQEPQASSLRRVVARIVGWLPLESQL